MSRPESKGPGWLRDGIDPTSGEYSPDVEQPPKRYRYPASEFAYDVPPGYTDSANATARTRLMRTGSPDGALIEDYAPGGVHGYLDRPETVVADHPHLLDPSRHRPPEVR